jgi:Ca-activated chloride channel homolog
MKRLFHNGGAEARRISILCFFVFVAAAAAFAQATAQQAPESTQPQTTLKVNVKLVNLFVSVVDPHGSPVAGLAKDNFQIFEDGRPEKIAVFERESELPLSIVLAIDTSLSTRKDIRLELNSARRFIHTVLRPQDRLALYQFSEIVDELQTFTNDLHEIDRALDRARIGSATALYDAVYLGSEALEKRKGRKVMVVVTDGGDTASKTDYQAALRSALEAEALVYSVIIVPIESNAGRNTGGEHALIQLAHDTGGKFFYAENPTQLDTVFKKIDEELRTQYMLAYYPSQRLADSEFRRIEVTVTPPAAEQGEQLTVRHRAGYYTMPAK